MRGYVLSSEAQEDLRTIRQHYPESAGVGVTRYVLGEIARAMQLIAETPGIGHARADLTNHAVKFWPVFSYFIVYEPEGRPVIIARVLHSSRDIARLLQR